MVASYFGFAQYFLPYPRPDTRIMLFQRDESDDWIQIVLSMDEQTMVLIHTGIGLVIIVITALITWHAPGRKWLVKTELRLSHTEFSTAFHQTNTLRHQVRAKPVRQAQGVPEGRWGISCLRYRNVTRESCPPLLMSVSPLFRTKDSVALGIRWGREATPLAQIPNSSAIIRECFW